MSSEDEDVLAAVNLVHFLNYNQYNVRKYWVHPFWSTNCSSRGLYSVFKELGDPERFKSFYRMEKSTFEELVKLVGPEIQKKDTNYRRAVCPQESLLITLRYFAGDSSMKAISYYFLRGETTVRNIVETTSAVLWNVLQPLYLPVPTKETWTNVADRYHKLWNLPNCVGSIDGKHIRIKAPANSGSAFYNYKGFFSVVLMATADADGKFLTIDVGEYGRNSDGRVFKECAFGQQLLQRKLDLPQPSTLPGEENESPYPYYFVGDEAFPLMDNLLRPYPRRQLTNAKRIFNYRLSRGRKSVECAFGMMTSKFRILESPISRKIEKVDTLVKALCVLHNFIRTHDGIYSSSCDLQESTEYSSETNQLGSQENRSRTRPSNAAVEARERLCNYFLKPYASLPWQNNYII